MSSDAEVEELDDAKAVARLDARWDRICAAAFPSDNAEYEELVRRWEPLKASDPICIPVDLLSPVGRLWKETSHTAFLSWLLDPKGPHGYGSKPLACFLSRLAAVVPEGDTAVVESSIPNCGDAFVASERMDLLATESEDEESSRRTRTDIWVELPRRNPQLVVVIENKVTTTTSKGQLARYEQTIEARRAAARSRPKVVKVFLTIDGDDAPVDAGGSDWRSDSFVGVGLALLPLLAEPAAPGTEMLSLYLASVFQGLYGIRWSATPPAWLKAELYLYLKARLEGVP